VEYLLIHIGDTVDNKTGEWRRRHITCHYIINLRQI